MAEEIKILIVEDEIIVALDIQNAVESFGYTVTDIATDDNEVFQSIEQNQPDIVLMDINLENSRKNGIDLASYIKEHYLLPVIYLTAFCDDDTINKAVATNPVGFLTKPFKREELKSAILLALYKMDQSVIKGNKINCTDIGSNYCYDRQNRVLYYKNNPLPLTPKELKLFELLFNKRGEVVPFEAIEFTIWEDNTVSSSTLRTLIYRLRAKLDYKHIETITQRGCRLI